MVQKILNINVVERNTGSAQYDNTSESGTDLYMILNPNNQINIQIVGLIIPHMHREYLTCHLILFSFRTYCKFSNNRRMLVSLA